MYCKFKVMQVFFYILLNRISVQEVRFFSYICPVHICESVFVFLRGNVEVFKVLGITEYTSLALTML